MNTRIMSPLGSRLVVIISLAPSVVFTTVIGGVPKGNRRDHNIVRVSSFASKELSWHERRCIVLVVPV